ncbi:MAG: hypothetical protein VX090_11390, partial [Pseudomonadota bacterium]|nr:hypothetical protein [Pseudomonadota bacterium]
TASAFCEELNTIEFVADHRLKKICRMKAESASRPIEHYSESLKFSSDLVFCQAAPKLGMLEPR